MVRKKTSSELEQAEIKLQSLMEKRDALNAEAQQARQERDLVHEKKREVGARLRPLKDRRASFAAEARAHREKRDELQAKAKALIELKRKLRASGPTDVGAELRALTRRVSQLEMRQQTASLSLSKENELIDELKASMKRLKVLQSLKADQDKIVKEVRDLDSGITDLFRAAEEQHESALAMSAKARAAHEETMGLSRAPRYASCFSSPSNTRAEISRTSPSESSWMPRASALTATAASCSFSAAWNSSVIPVSMSRTSLAILS